MTQFSVIIEKDEDENGYYASVPALQGCYAQGETFEEALENIKDAAKLHLDEITESGEDIPKQSQIFFTTIDIPIKTTKINGNPSHSSPTAMLP